MVGIRECHKMSNGAMDLNDFYYIYSIHVVVVFVIQNMWEQCNNNYYKNQNKIKTN